MLICTYYLQFSGSFFIFHFIFIYFHIDIVYECIVLRCIVENKLTYLLTYLLVRDATRPATQAT